MLLQNNSPFAAERLVTMDGDGFERLLVLIKATYEISEPDDGRVSPPTLCSEQAPLILADTYLGEAGESSLDHAGEAALFKPAADIILRGCAYPKRAGDPSVEVGLELGAVQKRLRVLGDRVWEPSVFGLTPSDPAPLQKTPLIYERAFGGIDELTEERFLENPIGVGFKGAKSKREMEGAPVPNFELLDQPTKKPGPQGAPCGFGPLAPNWEPRASFAGTYDEAWQKDRNPLPPEDFDPRFNLVAPQDQVLPGYVQGGELGRVRGVRPDGAALAFRAPRERPRISVRISAEELTLTPVCDTLVIDAEAKLLSLVWRASMSVQGRVYALERVLIQRGEHRA